MVAPFLKQGWIVSGVLLVMVGQGMLLSFPSSLLPALREADSPIRADLHTASWIASSIGVSAIPGYFISSYLMNKYGRRITHVLAILPGTLGWVLIYFASNVAMIMTGRILKGLTTGGTVGLGAVVIGEYSSPKNRGMFLNLKTASVCLGSMLVHILGNYCSWRTIAWISVIPHVVAIMMTMTWPESPSWLVYMKRFEECRSSYFWLRGKNESSVLELDELIKAQAIVASKSDEKSSLKENLLEFFRKFTKKDFLKPVFIVFLGSILLEVCGRHLFPAYALDIISEVTGNKSQSFYYTLGIDIIITTSATFSSVLVKLMKRRTLLFSTGLAGLLVLAAVCLYLLLASKDVISKDRPWIPISLFVVYFILVNLGCTPIPLAFLGEIFPLAHRGAGSSIAGVMLSVCVYLGLQLTPFLLVSMKVYGTFTVFGVAMAICLLLLYFVLPETKDRTLQEIEDYFNYGYFKDEHEFKAIDEEAEDKMIRKNEGVASKLNEFVMREESCKMNC